MDICQDVLKMAAELQVSKKMENLSGLIFCLDLQWLVKASVVFQLLNHVGHAKIAMMDAIGRDALNQWKDGTLFQLSKMATLLTILNTVLSINLIERIRNGLRNYTSRSIY